MRRGWGALKVGAAVGVCVVCCPPLLLVPLGLLGAGGAGVTATAATLGGPAWVLLTALLLTITVVAAGARKQRQRTRLVRAPVDAEGRMTLPLEVADPGDLSASAEA